VAPNLTPGKCFFTGCPRWHPANYFFCFFCPIFCGALLH
jgi:hypothetical protein